MCTDRSVKVQIVVCGDRLAGGEQQGAWPAFSEQAGGVAAEQEPQARPAQGLQEATRIQQQAAPAMQPSKREGVVAQTFPQHHLPCQLSVQMPDI